jgi:hypothetical protein
MHDSPWTILELLPTNNIKEIERAWRRLANIHHPDRGGDSEKFNLVREAYEVILSRLVKPIDVAITLYSTEVLREHTAVIEFDYQDIPITYHVLIPEWQAAWGTSKSIVVKTDQHLDLRIHITLVNDELEWDGKRLVWRPTMDLMPVLHTRFLEANWANKLVKLNVDDCGNAVLLSHGYKTSEGERLDITVQPKYIWPKKDP